MDRQYACSSRGASIRQAICWGVTRLISSRLRHSRHGYHESVQQVQCRCPSTRKWRAATANAPDRVCSYREVLCMQWPASRWRSGVRHHVACAVHAAARREPWYRAAARPAVNLPQVRRGLWPIDVRAIAGHLGHGPAPEYPSARLSTIMRRPKTEFNLNRILRELRRAAASGPTKGRTFFRILRRYVQARCRAA